MKFNAEQLRNFLNEIEADGNNLSNIEINFRHDDNSDVTPISFVFEDLHDEDNNTLTSIVLQSETLHQVRTNFVGSESEVFDFVFEFNKLIKRNAFKYSKGPYEWMVFGEDISDSEIKSLVLDMDFIIS